MDELLLLMDKNTFDRWFRKGVEHFAFGEESSLPDFQRNASDKDNPAFLVKIPQKYYRLVHSQRQAFLLFDEISTISLALEEQTAEWATRFRLLGEAWLPFQHRPNWLDAKIIPSYLVAIQQTTVELLGDVEQKVIMSESTQAQAPVETRKRSGRRTRSAASNVQANSQDVRPSREKKTVNLEVKEPKQMEMPLDGKNATSSELGLEREGDDG